MSGIRETFESVAVSTRMRLARNFADYPFPGRLLKDSHAEEQAQEIVRLIASSLAKVDQFTLYEMKNVSDERMAYLLERNLISRDLVRNRRISAALISSDEIISVRLNAGERVRDQSFMHGFDLSRAWERITGLDDAISEIVPFAFDEQFGYLTACPTNLGTGLRASVMLFLPALSRRGAMAREIVPELLRLGLTARGAYGEGSGAEGDLFQVSNEVTLGVSEEEILSIVGDAVNATVESELLERSRMKAEGGMELRDRICRAYGVLTNCRLLEEHEFLRLLSDIKLGLALGYFSDGSEDDAWMGVLDELASVLRPANINRLNGAPLDKQRQDAYRAEYARTAISAMHLQAE